MRDSMSAALAVSLRDRRDGPLHPEGTLDSHCARRSCGNSVRLSCGGIVAGTSAFEHVGAAAGVCGSL
jgi:hypothetical protein